MTIHNRNSIDEPAEILNKITELLKETCREMDRLHAEYNGITVTTVMAGYANFWGKVEKINGEK